MVLTKAYKSKQAILFVLQQWPERFVTYTGRTVWRVAGANAGIFKVVGDYDLKLDLHAERFW